MVCRLRGALPMTLLALLCLAATACGGATAPTPSVGISVTAPVGGAIVGVRTIEVSGTVDPADARVTVAGLPVTVRGGAFLAPLALSRPLTEITIRAGAAGYRPATVQTSVRYSPGAAGHAPSPTTRTSTHVTPAPATTTTTTTTTTTATTPTPSLSLSVTAAARQRFISGCVAGGGTDAACGCLVDALARSAIFHSGATFLAFVGEFENAATAHDLNAIPEPLRATLEASIASCIGRGLRPTASGG